MNQNKHNSKGASSDKTIIGPGPEAGFSPRDVLKEAERGDEIYLEMEFHDHKFERGRGTVVNVIEESIETDRMVRKTLQIEGVGENEMVNIALEYERYGVQETRAVADGGTTGNIEESD